MWSAAEAMRVLKRLWPRSLAGRTALLGAHGGAPGAVILVGTGSIGMAETADGFEIARRDLDIRGPGEFMGSRQSGAELLLYSVNAVTQGTESQGEVIRASIWGGISVPVCGRPITSGESTSIAQYGTPRYEKPIHVSTAPSMNSAP